MFRKTYFDFKKLPSHLKFSEKEIEKIIEGKIKGIRNYCQKFNFKKGIIGVSGGVDSSVCAVLATKALSKENIYFVFLPYFGITPKENLKDVEILAKNLKIPKENLITIPINKPIDATFQLLKKFKNGSLKIRKGNLIARERMKILFDLSAAFGAIVIGNENKSDFELGYYTLWGDEASGIEPIKDLWKTQVYQLASFLKEIPEEILMKRPSPELWRGHNAEKELKISYLEADIVLSAKKELKMSEKEIFKNFKISKEKIKKILEREKIGKIKSSLPFQLK